VRSCVRLSVYQKVSLTKCTHHSRSQVIPAAIDQCFCECCRVTCGLDVWARRALRHGNEARREAIYTSGFQYTCSVCVGPVYSPYANSPCSPWNLIVTHIVKISLNAESPCHADDSPLLGRCLQPDTQFRSFRLRPSGNPTRVCMKFIVPMSAIYGPGSSVGIATDYGLDRIPVGTRFSALPDWPWGPPSLL